MSTGYSQAAADITPLYAVVLRHCGLLPCISWCLCNPVSPARLVEKSLCLCRMMLHRHFQWLTTSSTLVYCVSKMSDYSQAQVARLVGLQASVIVAGTAASLMASSFKCECTALCRHTAWLCMHLPQGLLGKSAHVSIALLLSSNTIHKLTSTVFV